MSITAFSQSPNIAHLPGGAVPKTSQAFLKDSLVDRDTTNAYVKPSTSSSTTVTIFGVFVGAAVTTAASSPANLDVIPLIPSPAQLWLVDCTASTAANQLYKPQVLTDSATINNSSSATLSTAGVFIPIAISGAATDKKLIGYFAALPQVTA